MNAADGSEQTNLSNNSADDRHPDFGPALLTRTEMGWLLGSVQVSKDYQYRIKRDIKKKGFC
jgi:hypothetical protein